MKRLLPALLLLPLLLLPACAPSPYSYITNLNSGRGTNLICFGDSLTAGDGAPQGTAYPELLSGSVRYPVINAGVSGDTTTKALARLDRDVISKNPRGVIIELGANDYLQAPGSERAVNQAFDNLSQMIVRVQETGAFVVIADVGINADISERYKKLARTMRALYIPDILAGVMNNPEMMSDTLHPNSFGYARLAENILKCLQPVLNSIKQ
jgi:acyl-CoA thioesterase I